MSSDEATMNSRRKRAPQEPEIARINTWLFTRASISQECASFLAFGGDATKQAWIILDTLNSVRSLTSGRTREESCSCSSWCLLALFARDRGDSIRRRRAQGDAVERRGELEREKLGFARRVRSSRSLTVGGWCRGPWIDPGPPPSRNQLTTPRRHTHTHTHTHTHIDRSGSATRAYASSCVSLQKNIWPTILTN